MGYTDIKSAEKGNVGGRPALSGRGIGSTLLRQLPYIVLIALILAVPRYLFRPDKDGMNYVLTVLVYIGINTILAVGLNLLMGYAGQVSLGHAAFYGIGAYVSAILTAQISPSISYAPVPVTLFAPIAAGVAIMVAVAGFIGVGRLLSGKLSVAAIGFAISALIILRKGPVFIPGYLPVIGCCIALWVISRISITRLFTSCLMGGLAWFLTLKVLNHAALAGGISPWWAMLAGVLFTSLVAYLIGVQALRLHGHYLAMATLGFGIIVTIVLREWIELTGGTSGISGVPALSLHHIAIENDVSMYYLVWAIVVVVIVLASNIVNSRVGRAFRAVHGSEIAAASVGVDASRYKVQVFVLSAALASIAGSLYAHSTTRFVSPDSFSFVLSIQLVVMVVVGGMASIWGAILGAAAITGLTEWLRQLPDTSHLAVLVHRFFGQNTAPADLDVVIFAVVLILIMIFMPAGLVRGTVDAAKLAIAPLRRNRR